jgi:hypothetical protein
MLGFSFKRRSPLPKVRANRGPWDQLRWPLTARPTRSQPDGEGPQSTQSDHSRPASTVINSARNRRFSPTRKRGLWIGQDRAAPTSIARRSCRYRSAAAISAASTGANARVRRRAQRQRRSVPGRLDPVRVSGAGLCRHRGQQRRGLLLHLG